MRIQNAVMLTRPPQLATLNYPATLGNLGGGVPPGAALFYMSRDRLTKFNQLLAPGVLPAGFFSPDQIARYIKTWNYASPKDAAKPGGGGFKTSYASFKEVDDLLSAWSHSMANAVSAADKAEHTRRRNIVKFWNPPTNIWKDIVLPAVIFVGAILTAGALAPAGAAAGGAAGGVAAGGATGAGVAAGVTGGVTAAAGTGFAITGTLLETVAVTGATVGAGIGVASAAALAAGALGVAALTGAAPGTAIPSAAAPISPQAPLPGVTALPDLTVTAAADPGLIPGYALWGGGTGVIAAGGGLQPTKFEAPKEYQSEADIQKQKLIAAAKKYAIDYGTNYAMDWYAQQLKDKMLAAEAKRIRDELERARAEWAALQNTGVATAARTPVNSGKLPFGLLLSLALYAFK